MTIRFISLLALVVTSTFTALAEDIDSKICNYFRNRNLVELNRFLSSYVDKLPSKELLTPREFSNCGRRAIGMWYYNEGKYGKATEWLESVSYFELMDIINLSAALIKDGSLEKAERILKEALVKYPKEKHLTFNLALVYVEKGNYVLARKKLIFILNSPDTSKDLKSKALDILDLIGY